MNFRNKRLLLITLSLFAMHVNAQSNWDSSNWDADKWQAGGDSLYLDSDGDGVLNLRDEDDDGDGILDVDDLDNDNDSISDLDEVAAGTDPLLIDTDFDGSNDNVDVFPLDNTESVDTDSDGVGNNADVDDDGDGIIDENDVEPLNNLVGDSQNPVIFDIAALTVEASGILTAVELSTPDASDDNLNPVTLVSDYSGPLAIGTHQITWTATDYAGNTATKVQQVNVVDTTAPEFSELAIVTIDARGTLTNIASDISVVTYDLVDGEVSATTSAQPLMSGNHTVTVTATDAAGNSAEAELMVSINPIVEMPSDSKVEANGNYQLPVYLSGNAATYPVTIDYQLVGQFTGAATGQIIFAEGTQQTVNITVSADAIADETIELTLTSASNAVLHNDSQQLLTVVDINLSPIATTGVSQNGLPISVIDVNGGIVTVTANINDLNQNDDHTITWNSVDNVLVDLENDVDTLTFEFEPNSLSTGSYQLSLSVDENNTTELYGVVIDTNLFVEENLPTLVESADSDNDGVSDVDEGFSDTDGDGIADYLDDDSNTTRLPVSEDSDPLQTVNGLVLSLGDTAKAANGAASSGASVAPEDLGDESSEPDPEVNHYNFESEIINFNVSGLESPGDSVPIVLPLPTGKIIPENAKYRKYNDIDGWYDFVVDEHNSVSSSTKDADGNCPAPLSQQYSTGLTFEDECIQLIIEDGGGNDADGKVNGSVEDPGAMVTEMANHVPVINLMTELSADEESEVSLDASQTTDAEGDDLTFSWAQISGSNVVLNDNTQAVLTFTAPSINSDETLVFELTVNDGRDSVSATVNVNLVDKADPAPMPVIEDSSSSSGGSWFWLLAISAIACLPRYLPRWKSAKH